MSSQDTVAAQTAAHRPSLSYRAKHDGDEPAILSLFNEVFNVTRTEARWRWQYHDTPKNPGIVGVAEGDAKVLGFAGIMRQDLNFLGERLPAGQGCDSMMHPSCRGAGHYRELAFSVYDHIRAANVPVVTGFPNQASFPVTVRDIGHRRILVLRHYYRHLGVKKFVGRTADRLARPALRAPNSTGLRLLRLRMGQSLDMEVADKLPNDLSRILRAHRVQEVLSVWKDPEYLRWRYEQHPEYRYRFHVLRRNGEPVALAVVRLLDGWAAICELVHPRRHVRETAAFLRQIVQWYQRDADCQLIEFYGSDISFFDAAFAEAGFTRSAHSGYTMTATVLLPHLVSEYIFIPTNWTVVYGDTDVI